ncbi:hypothetical protein [Tunturiibacter gelidiferens]|uniref:hypothetical protein n=1 Tax=Tunturiibacter gelidiferens TaxID=3069689 RepID=UPI003D9B3128
MTTKKTAPVKFAIAKSEYKLPAAFQETGLRSVKRVAGTEIDSQGATPLQADSQDQTKKCL